MEVHKNWIPYFCVYILLLYLMIRSCKYYDIDAQSTSILLYFNSDRDIFSM